MDIHRFFRRRLQNLGVSSRDARSVANSLAFQYAHMGESRFLTYLKRVGDQILSYLYGGPKSDWVKTSHRFPKVIYALKKYPEELLIRISKFSRVVILDTLQTSQVRKVVDAVVTPYTGDDVALERMITLIELGFRSCGFKPLKAQPSNPKWVMNCWSLQESVSGPVKQSHIPLLESIGIVRDIPEIQNLPYVNDAFYPLADVRRHYDEAIPWDGFVGKIHAAQEPGGKLRMYAAPHAVLQNLLYPLHEVIDRYRRTLKTDCTYNQEAGALLAQEHLKSDRVVHSVDLSTATCRFPLQPQIRLLEMMGVEQVFIDALKFVIKGSWQVSDELKPQFPNILSWSVGQPLGIVPSMSMFSLTHNLLLGGICKELRLSPKDSFRVLGDDVVIFDDMLHKEYTNVVQNAGIPISWNKSHSSKDIAEFAGYTISKTAMMRPGKWRKAGILNHLSLADELGSILRGEVSHALERAQEIHLFAQGRYDPPVDLWPRFIRASSDIKSLELLGDALFPKKSWHRGAIDYMKTVLNGRLHLKQERYASGTNVYEPLSHLPPVYSFKHGNEMDFGIDEYPEHWMVTNHYMQACVNLHNAVVNQVISLTEAFHIERRVEAIVSSFFWREPMRLYPKDDKLTSKYLRTWNQWDTHLVA